MSAPDSLMTPPRRSWGRIALICALILSLFGNAVALGAWVRLREARSELFGSVAAGARLPDDLRAELRLALRAEAQSLRPFLQDLAQSRSGVVTAVTARPFMRADAAAAMDTFRDDASALLIEIQRIMLDHLEETAGKAP
jgi:uncharacterized membrane protein